MTALPTFAKLAPLLVHCPGLFRSPEKGNRNEYVRIEHVLGELKFELAGPVLGASELAVLQGLSALAGKAKALRSSPEDGDDFCRLNALIADSVRVTTSIVVGHPTLLPRRPCAKQQWGACGLLSQLERY